ncbi:hypothetical protein CBER1_10727 [Cercospora berteroae]|uniref:Uncharacterized protein n=1 Tax=Cercospora berteroae TaxID=357750 RepID=A0A2S6CKT7_9PEZI|nr:hypothetical protein CBER1_10727 [Cercospora berteroae]
MSRHQQFIAPYSVDKPTTTFINRTAIKPIGASRSTAPAKVLQKAFYLFRDNTWDLKIARVAKRAGILCMYDDKYNIQDDVFFDTPMQTDLSAKLLCGITRDIEEVDIRVDDSLWKIKRIALDGSVLMPPPIHKVLSVETIDGDTLVFDISGAQFGQYLPVLTLAAFMRLYRVPVIDMVNKFGTAHGKITQTLLDCLTRPNSDGRAQVLQAKIVERFYELVHVWEKKHALSMTEMTEAPYRRFRILMLDFLNVTYDAYADVMLKLTAGGSGFMDMRELLMGLEQTEPLPAISTLTLNNKEEGSAMHQLWVVQQKARLKRLEPEVWDRVYEPQLTNGGNVYIPIRPGGGSK